MADSQSSGMTHVELSPDDFSPADLLRIERLGRELRMVLELLSSFDLETVTIVNIGVAPAWTTMDGDHVYFSMKHMPLPTMPVDVAVWMGTMAHELGHVLFSPWSGAPLMRRAQEGERTFMLGISQLCNMVEDQRQERLLLARFAPWYGYLSAALGHHLVADTESAWLLMCGRTWLPQSVRDKARAQFLTRRSVAMADRVLSLVSDYQRLLDPGETESDEAWQILTELYDVFADAIPKMPRVCTVCEEGEPDTSFPGSGLPPAGDEMPEPGEPGEGAGEGQDGSGEAESDEDGDTPSTGAGNQPGSPQPFDQSEARKELMECAKLLVEDNPAAARDLADVLDALKHGRAGNAGADDEFPAGEHVVVTDNARRLHREVSDACSTSRMTVSRGGCGAPPVDG